MNGIGLDNKDFPSLINNQEPQKKVQEKKVEIPKEKVEERKVEEP